MLVISNHPRATHSSNLKLLRHLITPLIVLHLVQLLNTGNYLLIYYYYAVITVVPNVS